MQKRRIHDTPRRTTCQLLTKREWNKALRLQRLLFYTAGPLLRASSTTFVVKEKIPAGAIHWMKYRAGHLDVGQMVMDKTEATKILTEQLELYRKRSHSELTQLITEPDAFTVTGESGTKYGLEFEAVWDHEPGKNLRVIGSIDDGGWRALSPLCDDFIMQTDGSFVGE